MELSASATWRPSGADVEAHLARGREQAVVLRGEVGQRLAGHIDLQQPVGEVVGEVAVEEAVLPVLGDVGRHLRVLAALGFLLHRREVGLGETAGQFGDDLGGEDDALAVRQPGRCRTPHRQLDQFLGLATGDRDHVQRRISSSPRLLTKAMRLPSGLQAAAASLPVPPVSLAGVAIGHIDQPQAGGRLVLLDRPFLHADHRTLAIRRERGRADTLDRPQVLRGDRTLAGVRGAGECRQRAHDKQEGKAFQRDIHGGSPVGGTRIPSPEACHVQVIRGSGRGVRADGGDGGNAPRQRAANPVECRKAGADLGFFHVWSSAMGQSVVVLGAQWGDEGKGKIVDLLTAGHRCGRAFPGRPQRRPHAGDRRQEDRAAPDPVRHPARRRAVPDRQRRGAAPGALQKEIAELEAQRRGSAQRA
jgi:hypothetical protein